MTTREGFKLSLPSPRPYGGGVIIIIIIIGVSVREQRGCGRLHQRNTNRKKKQAGQAEKGVKK